MKNTRRSAFTLIELLVVIAIIAILAAILFPVFAQARAKARASVCLSNNKQIGLAVMQYTQDFDETYPVDNNSYGAGISVPQASWMRHIQAYSKNLDIFRCPDTPEEDNTQIIFGPGGTTADQIVVQKRSLGGNGKVFYARNAPYTATNEPLPVPIASVGKPADLPLVADSSFLIFTDPRYLLFASWPVGATGWAGASPALSTTSPDARYARHQGGVNILYGDGHAKWHNTKNLAQDAASTRPYPNNYLLPITPMDITDANGVLVTPADDRLK